MTNLNQHFHFTHEIRFDETDMAGIVHFSNYLKWVENAEHHFLKHLGIAPINAKGGFPKVHFSIDYRQPARFGEEITVSLILETRGTTSLKYKFTILGASSSVIAEGKMATTYVNLKGQPQALPTVFS